MNDHAAMRAVRDVIQRYIDGTYEADASKLVGVFHERAVMNGYLGDRCVVADPSVFIEDMVSAPSMRETADPYDAQIESIQVEGSVATAVLSETGFRGDGRLIDFFQLICIEGDWKIVAKLFTTV